MSSIVSALQQANAHHTHPHAEAVERTTCANASRVSWLYPAVLVVSLCLSVGLCAALFMLYTQLTQLHTMLYNQQKQQKQMAQRTEHVVAVAANQQDMLYYIQQQLQQLTQQQTANMPHSAQDNPPQKSATISTTSSNEQVLHAQNTGKKKTTNKPPAKTNNTQLSSIQQELQSALPWQKAPKQLQSLLDPSKIAGHLFDKTNADASFIIFDNTPLYAGSVLGGAESGNEVRLVHIARQTVYLAYQGKTYFLTLDLSS